MKINQNEGATTQAFKVNLNQLLDLTSELTDDERKDVIEFAKLLKTDSKAADEKLAKLREEVLRKGKKGMK